MPAPSIPNAHITHHIQPGVSCATAAHPPFLQAERLRAKAQRPSETGGRSSMQQQCRHLYYLGRIRAVQLEYSEAKDCLQQAARKVGAGRQHTPG